GNVNALDVIRAVTREPASLEALTKELHVVRGTSPELDVYTDAALAQARALDGSAPEAAFVARNVVEQLALAFQAALLVEHSPAVAHAFIASRISGRHGHTYGSLTADLAGSVDVIIDRALWPI
ncbi:MAG: hypothetical protein Q4P36_09620, partial [Bowdeniella nasicola]|nr:hypothetical protein [Bowdeniella nasicola]